MSTRHNDHPEDAMTRERALEREKIVVGQLLVCADCALPSADGFTYLNDAARRMLKDAIAIISTLASAQQEPAPAAEAEGVASIELKLRRALTFKEAEWVMAALRRYAGDSGVTEGPWRKDTFRVGDPVVKSSGYEFPGIVRAAFTTSGGVVRYVVEHSISVGLLHIFNENQIEAAARAKSGEKGGAR